jgi:hypothetical protein
MECSLLVTAKKQHKSGFGSLAGIELPYDSLLNYGELLR